MPLSPAPRQGLALLGCAAALAGCGWRLGAPPVEALSVGGITGGALEPSLAGALQEELARALRARGVAAGGPAVSLRVLADAGAARAAIPGEERSVAVWSVEVAVRAEVPAWPGCAAEARGARSWVLEGDPAATAAGREGRIRALAVELAERLADGILGSEACRTRS